MDILKTLSLRHRISPVPHRPGLVVGHERRLERGREETSVELRNLHHPALPYPGGHILMHIPGSSCSCIYLLLVAWRGEIDFPILLPSPLLLGEFETCQSVRRVATSPEQPEPIIPVAGDYK